MLAIINVWSSDLFSTVGAALLSVPKLDFWLHFYQHPNNGNLLF